MKKYYRHRGKKRGANKLATKSTVAKMIKKKDPSSLPDWRYIFGSRFESNVYRMRALADPSGGAQIVSSTAASGGVPVPSFGALSFAINTLNVFSGLATMFDQFRIVGVDIKFIPLQTADIAGTTHLGEFLTAVDIDDASTPTLADLKSYKTVQSTNVYRQHRHRFVPSVANTLYLSAVTSSYGASPGQWVDMANGGTPHFGVKYAFTGGTDNTEIARYAVDIWLHIELSNRR